MTPPHYPRHRSDACGAVCRPCLEDDASTAMNADRRALVILMATAARFVADLDARMVVPDLDALRAAVAAAQAAGSAREVACRALMDSYPPPESGHYSLAPFYVDRGLAEMIDRVAGPQSGASSVQYMPNPYRSGAS